MAVNVRSGDLDQLMLMPPSVRDWLPDNHLAFFVLDVVAELDLEPFRAAHRGDGRGGWVYDPQMMLAVLVYAYCTGERSSHRIERKLFEDVAFRVVATNLQPDHATLARFRRRHQDAIAALFAQVLGLCVKAGLVDAGVVAIDGTKLAADASFFANRNRDDLAAELAKQAQAAAEQVLDEAEAVDESEDELLGEQAGGQGGKMPDEWSGGRGRRERIRAALEELDSQTARDYESRMAERAKKEAQSGKKVRGPEPSAETARRKKPRRANTTDPHSRIIATSKGVVQGYNAQAGVTAGHVVVAAEVTVTSNDQPHFVPMAQAVNENLTDAGHQGGVGAFVADAGYWSSANATTDVQAEALIATRKTAWRKAPKPDEDKLAVLAKVNRGELSLRKAGDMLNVSHDWIGNMTARYFGKEGQRITTHAEPGPDVWLPLIGQVDRGEVTKRAAAGELNVSLTRVNAMLSHIRGETTDPVIARKAMDDKLAQPANRDRYKKRSTSVEPVFGNIKANLGFRRFSRRSLPAAQSEWRLICTVHNLLKLQRAALA